MQATVFASVEPAPWLGLPRSPGPAERSIASGCWPDWPSLGSSLPTRLASTTVLHSCPFTHRVHASRSSKPLSAELIDCYAVAVPRGRTAHLVSGRQTPYFLNLWQNSTSSELLYILIRWHNASSFMAIQLRFAIERRFRDIDVLIPCNYNLPHSMKGGVRANVSHPWRVRSS